MAKMNESKSTRLGLHAQQTLASKYEAVSNKITEEMSEIEESPTNKRNKMNVLIQPVRMFSRHNSITSPAHKIHALKTNIGRSPTRLPMEYKKLEKVKEEDTKSVSNSTGNKSSEVNLEQSK